jgi:effector-binding domain-containing protein
MKLILLIITSILVAGCSVVGQSNVETAAYTLLKADDTQQIEVRNYESMVLVSTDVSGSSGSPFRKLFNYISGENQGAVEIPMTAPVIMDDKNTANKGTKISMTTPVFRNEIAGVSSMSFVMPNDFTLETTPKPTNPEVRVTELKDYKVAAIRFSGTLSDSNVAKHTKILADWIAQQGYTVINDPVTAGYNAPFTLPMMRRNEVFIEVR